MKKIFFAIAILSLSSCLDGTVNSNELFFAGSPGSGVIHVGTSTSKTGYSEISFRLTQNLVSGDGIGLLWRAKDDANYYACALIYDGTNTRVAIEYDNNGTGGNATNIENIGDATVFGTTTHTFGCEVKLNTTTHLTEIKPYLDGTLVPTVIYTLGAGGDDTAPLSEGSVGIFGEDQAGTPDLRVSNFLFYPAKP